MAAAILNFVFGHISVVNEDIFVKFGTLIDIGHTRVAIAQYIPPLIKLKNGSSSHLGFAFLAQYLCG